MIGALMLAAAVAAIPPVVDGAVVRPLTATTFAALPRASVGWTVHGAALTCTGPWLIDVVAATGVPTGEAVRGDALSTVVTATGADGYRAVFTLAELDRTLGNAPVLLAEHCDGAADDGGYRLIPATDRRGARGVRNLVRLTVARVP